MKIMHLSDLHFGTEKPELVAALLGDITHFAPDAVIISGDLTQRATKQQYISAQHFIKKINVPVLCVPGNHDIPLYNLFVRFLYPFNKYKKWIAPTLCTALSLNEVAFLGINSVTPYKPMGGYVTDEQLKMIVDFFQSQPQGSVKIVVMHHNLIRSERHKNINNAENLIKLFAKCGVNLVLSGHIHTPHIERLKLGDMSHPMYVSTAGTAISTRTQAPNSYNYIDLNKNGFTLIVRDFNEGRFVSTSQNSYSF